MRDEPGTTGPDDAGRLAQNIVHFVRALRKAGVRVGTAQVETAIRAVAAAGFSHRTDFYHTLRATLITRADDLEIFHQVFALFWRDPDFLQKMLHMMSPKLRDDKAPPPKQAGQRRATDALGDRPPPRDAPPPREELVTEALMSWSDRAVLARKDFEQMTATELAEAARAIRTLALPLPHLVTRRRAPSAGQGRVDPRATLRASLRRGGELAGLHHSLPRPRPPDLVALCDISGSMAVYSRMLLRFLHAMAHARDAEWARVRAFTFGTRLTNVSRALARPDPDVALGAIGQEATDWEGGTRIGAAIERFNKDWSRRVLGSGAVVILITDGLERDDTERLGQEVARLARSCRRLVWLNPLLRFDGFSPRAGGIRAILPHVSSLHACHSLDSLSDLATAFGERGLADRMRRAA
jgi:uncharacterized protein